MAPKHGKPISIFIEATKTSFRIIEKALSMIKLTPFAPFLQQFLA